MAKSKSPRSRRAPREGMVCLEPDAVTHTSERKVLKVGKSGEWIPSDQLKAEILEHIREGDEIIIDLESLLHLEAGALQVLLAAQTELKKNGKTLALVHTCDELQAWFTWAGATFAFASEGKE